jgi:hypothetical protein
LKFEVKLPVAVEMIPLTLKGQESITEPVTNRELVGFELFDCCQKTIDVLAQTHLKRGSHPCCDIRCEDAIWHFDEVQDGLQLVELAIVGNLVLDLLK